MSKYRIAMSMQVSLSHLVLLVFVLHTSLVIRILLFLSFNLFHVHTNFLFHLNLAERKNFVYLIGNTRWANMRVKFSKRFSTSRLLCFSGPGSILMFILAIKNDNLKGLWINRILFSSIWYFRAMWYSSCYNSISKILIDINVINSIRSHLLKGI